MCPDADDDATPVVVVEDPKRSMLEAELEIAKSVIHGLRRKLSSTQEENEAYRLENQKLKLELRKLINRGK